MCRDEALDRDILCSALDLISTELFSRCCSNLSTYLHSCLSNYFHQTKLIKESQVHIVRDNKSGSSKGFAFIEFDEPSSAEQARSQLDGTAFQGRLIHVLHAVAKREHVLGDAATTLSIKGQKQIKLRAGASTDTFRWNSMYMNTDAVLSSMANKLGVSKSEIIDPTSSDAAIKQAHAETIVIQETKTYLQRNGVDLDCFRRGKSGGLSDTAILVKNFPFGTTAAEIKERFHPYGEVKRLLVPPSGTIAVVEMAQASQARSAFGPLAYSKFKNSVLFLEKAPRNVFDGKIQNDDGEDGTKYGLTTKQLGAVDFLSTHISATEAGSTSTLYVRNLNFSTTTQQLSELFRSLSGYISARVKTKTDPKKPGQLLSMGFGFVEFRSKAQAQAALAALNGHKLAGHTLVIRESHRGADAAEERRQDDIAKKVASHRTKIIIKNLPFETTEKDVRALLKTYGQLRSVRLPEKPDSSSRGFAFADFITSREAGNAMEALRDTHLLGRRLVIDFALADTTDAEEQIARMQAKTERQTDKEAIQKLTNAGARKKFRPYGHNEEDDE